MALCISKWLTALVCSRRAYWHHFHLNLTIILMILAWMISILLIGGLLCWLVVKWNIALVKWIALLAVLIDFVLICNIWLGEKHMTDTWFINYQVSWIPSFGISFHVALDGLSTVMLMLTFFLGTLSVLCSWKEIKQRTGFYYFNLLWTIAGISGVFVALDLFLFYFFWEVMLIPMYFLIAIWGDSKRRYAAYKFFIFTQAGGLLMLISILALYFIHYNQTGTYSFDYLDWLKVSLSLTAQKWLLAGFLAAFLVKLPALGLHTWL